MMAFKDLTTKNTKELGEKITSSRAACEDAGWRVEGCGFNPDTSPLRPAEGDSKGSHWGVSFRQYRLRDAGWKVFGLNPKGFRKPLGFSQQDRLRLRGRAGWKVFLLAGLVLALFLIIAGVKAVSAQAPTPSDNDVNAVARELYCPVCENIPLDVCPTTACAQWREMIREMLAQGKSKEEIKQYFVAQYGDRVLATPPRSGLHWLVYGLPPVVLLLGIYLVYRVMRGTLTRRPRAAAGAFSAADLPPNTAQSQTLTPPSPRWGGSEEADPYLARVEEELRKRNA